PVETHVAVELVDDVVVLGVEPPGDLGMKAKRIDGAMVVPAPVDISGAALVSPDVPELRVEHRLAVLAPGRQDIPLRPGKRAVADLLHVGLPAPAGEVFVPGIQIGARVAAVATD